MNTDIIHFHRIKSIIVVGGFLDGVNIEFSEGLNCLIGPRGTGKTTVLEFIRYALNSFPDGERGSNLRKQVEPLIRSNLGDGRIRVTIETKDGLEYIIDRTAIGEPIVLTAKGEPTEVTLTTGNFFVADIFSQNEVEEIADNSYSQLLLLDSFIQETIRELDEAIMRTQDDLRTNTNRIIPLQRKQADLVEQLNTMPQVDIKLKTFATTGGANATEINQAHTVKALRERETNAIKSTTQFLVSYTSEIKDVANKFKRNLALLFSEDILRGPNGKIMSSMLDDLRNMDGTMKTHFNEVISEIGKLIESISIKTQNLKSQQDLQELEFRNLIEKHKEAQGQAIERAKWEHKRNELLTKKQALDEIVQQLEHLMSERQTLLATLSDVVDKRFKERQKVAEFITNNVTSDLRVQLTQFGNKTNYENFLAECLKNAGINHKIVASRVVAAIAPNELGLIIRQNNCNSLIELADINPSQAEKVIKALASSEHLLALEVVELVDLPSIELRDGAEYKNSLHLSTGQKCTTILPILLLESENPLLVDQPEDNLDNRFIFETVVDSIHKVRQRRQMIFITHNPNIPVLGEASKVYVLASDGTHARIVKNGTVDECKHEIINLLEGGKDAFLKRKARYNY
jgi:ABC-type lipoprotein export system ATPase subunit